MLKYIMIEGKTGLETPIIFPDTLKHNEVAEKFNRRVISAGFIQVYAQDELNAYGESISLDAKSRPEDSKVINRYVED